MSQSRAPLTFVSFSGEDSNLGIVVLDGTLNARQAADRASELGINPGGEVLVLPVPRAIPDALYSVHFENRNRLIAIEEGAPLFGLVLAGDAKTLPVSDKQVLDQGEPN